MVLGDKIKGIRLKRGLSRKKVAQKAGVSYDYIAKIESDKRSPNTKVLGRIAAAMGVDVRDFLEPNIPIYSPQVRDSSPPFRVEEWGLLALGEGRRTPLLGWVEAGDFSPSTDKGFEPGEADDYIYANQKGRSVFALKVQGDSMEPEFREGEVIIVNPDFEAGNGDYVVAKLAGEEEATFKQLIIKRRIKGRKHILHPLNPSYPDIPLKEGYRIVGKVVEKKTFFKRPGNKNRSLTSHTALRDSGQAQLINDIHGKIKNLNTEELKKILQMIDILT